MSKTNKPKYYAVLCNGQVGRTESLNGACGIQDILTGCSRLNTSFVCSIINPATLKVMDDACFGIFPGPGMVVEILPWDVFVEEQKKKREQMQRSRAQHPTVIPVQAPPGLIYNK